MLLVARGDARIEHKKFKEVFGKGKMLPLDEVVELTGHPVGGVCPFGLANPLPVYLDRSLLAFDEVLPAAGATAPSGAVFILKHRSSITFSSSIHWV